jgi:hypothetical protein
MLSTVYWNKGALVLLGGENWKRHRFWLIFSILTLIAASAWYFAWDFGKSTWPPGGSSLPGFSLGLAGGLIILFEMLLWWRKKVRSWRIGKAQAWLRAHIWLGLLCLPLLVYHSGFRLGGTLSTLLLLLLIVVVASGIFGLIVQQLLPARMLREVPSETIYSQIPHVLEQFCEEADRFILAVCGPGEKQPQTREPEVAGAATVSHLTIGAVRAAGKVQGKVLQTRVLTGPVPGSEPLRKFYQDSIRPFLQYGNASGSALAAPNRAEALFRDLRSKVNPAAHDSVSALEDLCGQRRQLDLQARMHFWLHCWLWVHLPLSVALVMLMIFHVWVALRYW